MNVLEEHWTGNANLNWGNEKNIAGTKVIGEERLCPVQRAYPSWGPFATKAT